MCFTCMMENGGMELHKLHIGHCTFGAINHRDTVARSDDGVRRGVIDSPYSTRAHHSDFAQIGIYFLRIRIQHVCTKTFYIGCAACHLYAQMVLRDNLYGEMMFLDLDIGMGAQRFHHPSLDFSSCIVGMMKNTELRVAAFAMQVELAIRLSVEVHTPMHHLIDLGWCHANHLFYGSGIRNLITCNHRVFDVLFEVIDLQIGNTRHTALSERGVRLVERGFTDDTHFALVGTGYLQCIAHSCHSCTDNQEIILICHNLSCLDGDKSTYF